MPRSCFINGSVISGKQTLRTDVLVENGIITALGDHDAFALSPDDTIIDCTGKLILPGLIDAHCHIQLDTGIFHTEDDWWSGSQEAARGGITTVIDFVGPSPGEDLRHALDFRLDQAKKSLIDYTFHMTVLDDTEQSLAGIDKCPEWGISSLKIYTTYRPNYYLDDLAILHILERARDAGLVTLIHCENDAIVTHAAQEVRKKFDLTKPGMLWKLYPLLRPEIAEVEAAERMIRLAHYTQAPVVIAHNSSDETVRAVAKAKELNWHVYNETAPQYLCLNNHDNCNAAPHYFCQHSSCYAQETEDTEQESWRYILQPPLRFDITCDALCEEVNDGHVDMLITDHCAYTRAQKLADPTCSPGGLPGFETLLPVSAAIDGMTWQRLAQMLCENPAQIYGLWPHKGCIAPGFDADLIIIKDETYTLDESKLHSFAGYSPFHGHKARGIIERVFRRGEEVVRNGEILGKEGTGMFLHAKCRQ
ncbi:MAG: amidohydrolase family protein [Proteobacteria bacterium]|nr:amidohydrolase family protein [Pseudomonadota bacterium]